MTKENTEYFDILESVKSLNNHDLITVTNGSQESQVLILPEGKRAENIKEIENLLENVRSTHFGFVSKYLKLLIVSSPPHIILASLFMDSILEISSDLL